MTFLAFELMQSFIDDYEAGARDVRNSRLKEFFEPDRSGEDIETRFVVVEEQLAELQKIGFFTATDISALAALFDPAAAAQAFQDRMGRAGLNVTLDDPFEEVETTRINIRNRRLRQLIQTAIEMGAVQDADHLSEVVERAGGELTSIRSLHYKNELSPATGVDADPSGAITLRRMKSYITTLTGLRQI